MKTIVIILLLIVVAVGVIVVYFPDIINNTTPSILHPDTQQTTTKPPTKEQTTKPPSKCVEKSLAIDIYYPPSPSAWDEDAQGYRKPKNVNDINECKNECDKYTGCKSYAFKPGMDGNACWLGSNSTLYNTDDMAPTLFTSCLK